MLKEKVKIKKLKETAKIPTYGTDNAAGTDLYACIEENMVFAPHETKMVPTGLSFELPVGYAGLIYARSGLASKRDLAPANKVGVVDSDYRGEVMIVMHNHGEKEQIIEPNERIAQFIITPYLKADFVEVDYLEDSERGNCGFGSTGTK